MLLPDRLRQSISTLHTSIESTPLAVAMISGTITRPEYAWWMVQMTHLHAAVEEALQNGSGFETLYDPMTMNRSETLSRDAAALNVDRPEHVSPSVDLLGAELLRWSADTPWKLLGVLYVLEGSRMGSLALARPISRALGVPLQLGAGLDYHIEGAAQRPQTWQLFRAKLAQMALTEAEMADVQEAAGRTMQTLFDMYTTAPTALAGATSEHNSGMLSVGRG